MIKTIIFDLDDTLYPESKFVMSGFNSVSKYLSQKINYSEEKLYRMLYILHEESPQNVFNRLSNILSLSDKTVTHLIANYRHHSPLISLEQEVKNLLKNLKENYYLALITDGLSFTQRNKVKALGLDDFMDLIVYTQELGINKAKPHPESYQLIKKRFSSAWNEIIYVGDNPEKDFYIKKKYPLITIRIDIKGYYHRHDYLENIKEDFLIHDYNEIYQILKYIELEASKL